MPEIDEPFCYLIADFMKDKDVWNGTATELCNELKTINNNFNTDPANVKKELMSLLEHFNKKFGIAVEFGRTHSDKLITLTRNKK